MFLLKNRKNLLKLVILSIIICISLLTVIFGDNKTEEIEGIQYLEFYFFYIEIVAFIVGIVFIYAVDIYKYIEYYCYVYALIVIIYLFIAFIEFIQGKLDHITVICTILRLFLVIILFYYKSHFFGQKRVQINEKVKTREIKIDIDEENIEHTYTINEEEEEEEKVNEYDDEVTYREIVINDPAEEMDVTHVNINNDKDNGHPIDDIDKKPKHSSSNKLKKLQYWKNKRDFFINYTKSLSRSLNENDVGFKKERTFPFKHPTKFHKKDKKEGKKRHRKEINSSKNKDPNNCYSFFIDESIMVPGHHTHGIKPVYIDQSVPIAKPVPVYSCSDDNSSGITQKLQQSSKTRNKKRVIKDIYQTDSVISRGPITEDAIETETELSLGMDIQGDLGTFVGTGTITDTENDFYSPSPLKNSIYHPPKENDRDAVFRNIEKRHRDEVEEGSLYVSIDHINEAKMTPVLTENDNENSDHPLSSTTDKKIQSNTPPDNISSSLAVNLNNTTTVSSSPMSPISPLSPLSPLSPGSTKLKPLPVLPLSPKPLSPQSLSSQSLSPRTMVSSSSISKQEHRHSKHRHHHHHHSRTESSVIGTNDSDRTTSVEEGHHHHHRRSKVRSSNILSDDQSQSDSTHKSHHRHHHHHSKDRAHRHHHRQHHSSSRNNPSQLSKIDVDNESTKEKNKRIDEQPISITIPESMNILKEDLNRYNYSKYDFPSSPSTISSTASSISSMKTETPLIKRFY